MMQMIPFWNWTFRKYLIGSSIIISKLVLLNVIFGLSPYQSATINIDGWLIKSINSQKLLGFTIDSNFTFEGGINSPCQNSSQKLHALSRISQHLSPNRKHICFKTFVTSQSNYCSLVWMCHGRTLNIRINIIHHRALRIIYQDKKSSFEWLLQKEKSTSVHMEIYSILLQRS